MKNETITESLTEELEDKLSEEVETLRKLRVSHAVSPLESPALLSQKRRTIARIKTELHKRTVAKQAEVNAENK